MGQPAARLGDITAHGGAIVMGFPNVLIGGAPAARIGDMHLCPMLTPGVPPIPHVGGPIVNGSPTVLIGGMPAARVGDILVCVGPPDTIALGCFTVLIGEAGAGGGGGGSAGGGGSSGGGGGFAGTAAASVVVATNPPPNPPPSSGPPSREGHWIKYEFVDKTNNPVSGVPYKFTAPDSSESEGILEARGTVWWSGENAGQGIVNLMDVSNARWSTQEARVGDTVTLIADVEGYPSGTDATFTVFKRDVSGADRLVTTIETQTQGNRVEVQWQYVLSEDRSVNEIESEERRGYTSVKYYFIIRVRGQHARSGLLEYKDWIEIELKNQNGDPMANEEYVIYLGDGGVRRGNLDQNGRKREEGIPPGKCYVVFPGVQNVAPVSM